MTHNIPRPSKYGAETTYEGDGTIKNIVPPDSFDEEVYRIPVNRPRIVRKSGSLAVGNSVTEPQPLPHATLGDAYGYRPESTQSDAYTTSAQTPNQRQQSLDIAEVQNKVKAAEAAGMTVDQWNANGRPMKGTYSSGR